MLDQSALCAQGFHWSWMNNYIPPTAGRFHMVGCPTLYSQVGEMFVTKVPSHNPRVPTNFPANEHPCGSSRNFFRALLSMVSNFTNAGTIIGDLSWKWYWPLRRALNRGPLAAAVAVASWGTLRMNPGLWGSLVPWIRTGPSFMSSNPLNVWHDIYKWLVAHWKVLNYTDRAHLWAHICPYSILIHILFIEVNMDWFLP